MKRLLVIGSVLGLSAVSVIASGDLSLPRYILMNICNAGGVFILLTFWD